MNRFFPAPVRIATAGLLFLLVTGLLPVLVQGYAYLDMAYKAGGFEKLGFAVTEAEPCEYCHIARELADSRQEDSNLPVTLELIQFLKTATLSDFITTVPGNSQSEFEKGFPIPGNQAMLSGLRSGPMTPPPRV